MTVAIIIFSVVALTTLFLILDTRDKDNFNKQLFNDQGSSKVTFYQSKKILPEPQKNTETQKKGELD